jgi:hypothetical protein
LSIALNTLDSKGKLLFCEMTHRSLMMVVCYVFCVGWLRWNEVGLTGVHSAGDGLDWIFGNTLIWLDEYMVLSKQLF